METIWRMGEGESWSGGQGGNIMIYNLMCDGRAGFRSWLFLSELGLSKFIDKSVFPHGLCVKQCFCFRQSFWSGRRWVFYTKTAWCRTWDNSQIVHHNASCQQHDVRNRVWNDVSVRGDLWTYWIKTNTCVLEVSVRNLINGKYWCSGFNLAFK